MRLVQAKRIVAAAVLESHGEDAADSWDGWPDLGENDWCDVLDIVRRRAASPYSRAQYDEAYALLASRAEGVEA